MCSQLASTIVVSKMILPKQLINDVITSEGYLADRIMFVSWFGPYKKQNRIVEFEVHDE